MRNLKKALSLSLALVMLLGMMVVGAGAASFTDVADNTEKIEAIEVMKAINVLQGYDDGKFHPDDTLTRAQAATIIAKAVMGPKVVEALNKTDVKCEFEDVNTSASWAAPVIQACVNQGIIAGNGDGTFAPNATVTGEQFAAMLLRALGFDKTEYANNPNWAFNVRRDAIKAGLNANGVVVSSAEMKREDAAQMGFSAIQYSPSGSNGYKIDGGEPKTDVVFSSVLEAMLYQANQTTKGTIQTVTANDSLASTVFGLSKGTDTDDFERTVETWVVGGKAVYTSATPVGATTWTTGKRTTDADVKNLTFASDAKCYVNGADGVVIDSLDDLVKHTGLGVQVSVYKNAKGEVNKVVVVSTILAQISNVNETSKKIYLSVKGGYDIAVLKNVDDKNDCYDTLAALGKGAYVLVTAANGVVSTVAEPVVVTGIVSVKESGKATVGGTSYNFAKGADSSVTGLIVDAKKEQMVYTDAAGNAYYATGVDIADETDVVYVTAVYTGVSTFGEANAQMFQGVLPTGEIITGVWEAEARAINGTTYTGLDLTQVPEATEDNADPKSDAELIEDGKFKAYSYVIAPNGKYLLFHGTGDVELSNAETVTTATLDTSKKTVNVSPLTTTRFAPSVKVVYVDGQKGTLTAQLKDGKQFVSVSATSFTWAVLSKDADDNMVVSTVFVKDAPATANDAVIYAHKSGCNTNKTKLGDDGKTRLYSYELYVNGEMKTIWCKTASEGFAANTFYSYSIDETTGAYVISAPRGDNNSLAKAAVIAANGVKKFNGVYAITNVANADSAFTEYDLTNATVHDLTGGDLTNVEALRIKSNDKNGTAIHVSLVANTEDKVVTTVYVTKLVGAPLTGANVAVNETVAKGEEITTSTGTTTINADVNGKVNVKGETTITGTIGGSAEINVDAGKKLVIDGAIDAGAKIVIQTTDDLANIKLGPNANIADGSINSVVFLPDGSNVPTPTVFSVRSTDEEADDTDEETGNANDAYELTSDAVKTLNVGVPVYAAKNKTVAVKWELGVAGATVTKVTEYYDDGNKVITVTDAEPELEDGVYTTMLCLNNPGDDTTGFEYAGAGNRLTVKVVCEYTKDNKTETKTVVLFTMENYVKPEA